MNSGQISHHSLTPTLPRPPQPEGGPGAFWSRRTDSHSQPPLESAGTQMLPLLFWELDSSKKFMHKRRNSGGGMGTSAVATLKDGNRISRFEETEAETICTILNSSCFKAFIQNGSPLIVIYY